MRLRSATQHVRAADRFARKIGGFLKSSHSARSRRLTHRPFGGGHQRHILMYATMSSELPFAALQQQARSSYDRLQATGRHCPPVRSG